MNRDYEIMMLTASMLTEEIEFLMQLESDLIDFKGTITDKKSKKVLEEITRRLDRHVDSLDSLDPGSPRYDD